MDFLTLVLFGAGLVLLVAGAELLVRGASRLALAVGVSPLVVGLTVVAYGTSSPELAVSLQSALEGRAELAVGNVVGSNIFNVLFILGLSALVLPLVVARQLVWLEVPLMIGASFLMLLLGLDGRLGRLDGLLLAAGAAAYTVFTIRRSRREARAAANGSSPGERGGSTAVNVAFVAAGLGLLVLGSRWLVEGAVTMAISFGLSELVVGLTIVAAGTSLPEVATSVVAGLRGQQDIAVGNVIGSNIFNLLAVLGFTSLLAPAGIAVPPGALAFDVPVMIAVAVACLPIFFTGHLIARWEGLLFLSYYVAYTAYLVLNAARHDALPLFNQVMLLFVLPLTVVTLVVLAVRAGRNRQGMAGR